MILTQQKLWHQMHYSVEMGTEIEISPLVLGRIKYTSLRKEWDIDIIRAELAYRGSTVDGNWKKDLLERLKSHENNIQICKAICPDINFDDIHLV